MTQSARRITILRFGVFEVDLRAGELRRNGRPLRLQEKPFQLLAALLEHPGEVVTKEELQQRLWPDVAVDADAGLGEAVYRLRQARTIPRMRPATSRPFRSAATVSSQR